MDFVHAHATRIWRRKCATTYSVQYSTMEGSTVWVCGAFIIDLVFARVKIIRKNNRKNNRKNEPF